MRYAIVALTLAGIAVIFVCPASGQVLEEKTLERFYDPIEVRTELFPQMHNRELDHLGLLACHDEKLEFIPYQFDEWTAEGEMILKWGEENKCDNRLNNWGGTL